MQATAERPRASKKRSTSIDSIAYQACPEFSLATEAGRAAVARFRQQLLDDPEKARQFFRAAGILTSKNQLAKRYGG